MIQRLTFQKVTENDWETVIFIEKSCETLTFLAYTKEEDSRKYLRNSQVWIIKLGDKIIGTISYEEKSLEHAYIDAMTILPEYRGKGFATEAMIWLMAQLKDYKSVDLVTHPRNSASLRVYLKFGFKITEWKDNYFGDGQPRLHLFREDRTGI